MYATSAKQARDAQVKVLAERLYRKHHAYLLRIATRNAVDGADAEEALQFAFLAFIEHFDPAGKAPPLAWLTLYADLCVMPTRPREPALQAGAAG